MLIELHQWKLKAIKLAQERRRISLPQKSSVKGVSKN